MQATGRHGRGPAVACGPRRRLCRDQRAAASSGLLGIHVSACVCVCVYLQCSRAQLAGNSVVARVLLFAMRASVLVALSL
jgi:hypothetical protein